MKLAPSRIHLVLGFLIVTTLAILLVCVYWNLVFFPPAFTGWGEVTPDQKIAGWAINRRDANRRVEVQLYIDDRFVGHTVAELPRPDVVQAGWTQDPRCGYAFPVPALSAGVHEARVYGMYQVPGGNYVTLQMTGDPLKFSVDADGSVMPVK